MISSGSPARASISAPVPAGTSSRYSDNQMNESLPPPQSVVVEDSCQSQNIFDDKKGGPLAKIEALQIKFLCLVRRLGLSSENLVVAQVLYRLQLASLIRAGESDVKRVGHKTDKARAIAAAQEGDGQADLDFSFKILVLGKTGVGKSATINSIFDQSKAATDAFRPATKHIQEVVGTVSGIKITFIDTPGLLPSCSNQRQNRKMMLSVKRYIKKSPPDIVLYFERLDVINMGYSDFPLLKLITDVLGSAIWFNTILVMTHCSSALPEGSDGYPVSYEGFVTRCTSLVQHYIHQAVSDTRLENPILLVENHSSCKTNMKGEKVLPNGQVWWSQFMLLCASTKVLGDANALLKFQDSIHIGQTGTRLPSLPHLLSSLLQPRSLFTSSGSDGDVDGILDTDDDDDYDQLPPIRILTKAQFERLTNAQKNDYLDELDYRETLYLKKQLKEELRRRRNSMLSKDELSPNDDNFENETSPEAVPLPDMTIPLSFDSDFPVYRYRCLLSNDRWLARPVLDSQGWDHDVGFDGINVETSVDVKQNLHASVVGQMSKDKHDFRIQSECAAAYVNQEGPSVYAGIDIQTSGRDLVCTIRGDTKLRNLKHNMTGCGFSLTSFGNKYFIGAKLEDSVSVGKRLKIVLNAGRIGGNSKAAYGGSLEATLRGKDYPVRDDKIGLAMTVLNFDKETVLGGSIQSDFRPRRGTKMSVNANLNSRRMGQVSIRTNSSEHFEIALIILVPIVRALFRGRRAVEDSSIRREMEG
ncbi:translocase of chloroplast 90, chloroplastic isoform X2 [Magnolia sinica]|uniref:translocase of chloroplast 90, chloroplastic isoform X2 n=1 Tax=Magnolia sinica TaxID=86752 RepID=UPI00265A32C1|nr:translocase of chloroplast 90, chloroplastic isoform X2 [Magnolia sinica]